MRIAAFYVAVSVCLASVVPAIAAPPANHSLVMRHPQVHQIDRRMRAQWRLIHQGLKSSKLTKDQAKALRAALKSIQLQEVSFFKQNHTHKLTPVQQNQLNSALDQNAPTLGEKTAGK